MKSAYGSLLGPVMWTQQLREACGESHGSVSVPMVFVTRSVEKVKLSIGV